MPWPIVSHSTPVWRTRRRYAPANDDRPLKLADQGRPCTLFKQSSVKNERTGLAGMQPKKAPDGTLDDFPIAYLVACAE